MNWRTSKLGIKARSVGRKLGVNRVIARSTLFGGSERYPDDALLAEIRPGDVVWDVGANIGIYACAFAERAGSSGRVIAFEPSRRNRERLAAAAAERPEIVVRGEALGAAPVTVRFVEDDTENGVTSRIDYAQRNPNGYDVTVATADSLVAEGLPVPDVIKIDVEGAERDVLDGMVETLRRRQLHTVYVEVHFSILEQRGRNNDPAVIEATLKANGFVPRWLDASHILAERGTDASARG